MAHATTIESTHIPQAAARTPARARRQRRAVDHGAFAWFLFAIATMVAMFGAVAWLSATMR